VLDSKITFKGDRKDRSTALTFRGGGEGPRYCSAEASNIQKGREREKGKNEGYVLPQLPIN